MSNPLDLTGQAILVVGAANGMGRAISLALAEAGAALALIGRDTTALKAVAAEIDTPNVVLACDITKEDEVIATFAAARATLSAPTRWGLVNVAGGAGPSGKRIWEHSLAEVQEIFEINVFGSFLTMKHALPDMMAAGAGCVVNIGGTFGFKGAREASAYGATKWAMRGFTKSAALEAGRSGVRVNMVSPGPVDGPRWHRQLNEAAVAKGSDFETQYNAFVGMTALGRASQDTDVANAVLFLMSDAARNITGQDLLVDGGTIV